MISLIVSNLALNGAIANDTTNLLLSPQTQILTNSVKIELPMPVKTARQKYIINVTLDDGFICHNFLREKEIKDKLFSLQTKADLVPVVENKLLEDKKPVSLIDTNTYTSGSIGVSLGLIIGFFIFKK
jgi:hypothetical protein